MKQRRRGSQRRGQPAQTDEESLDTLLPPVVELIADPRGLDAKDQELVLKYRLRSPSQRPVTRVEVADRRPIVRSAGLQPAESDYPVDEDLTISIPIPRATAPSA